MFSNLLQSISNVELRLVCRKEKIFKSQKYKKYFSSFLVYISEKSSSLISKELIDFLENNYKKTKVSMIVSFLEYLETDFILNNQLISAYEIRLTRYHFLIFKYGIDKKSSIQLFWALVFNNSYNEAKNVCDSLQKRVFFKINKDKLSFLSFLISNKGNYNIPLSKRFDLPLQNKKVAVYGPLFEELNYNSDYVPITIGYKGNGHKCFASFYNAEAALKIRDFNNKDFFNELEYAVFFKKKYDYQKEIKKQHKFRFLYSIDFLFELGQPNMLQNMTFHLLRANPNSLFLTGFNMYLSKRIYGSNYNDYKNSSMELNSVSKSFAHHNIISQYQFMHFLYKNSCVQCDDQLHKILNMGIISFLHKMEKLLNEN